jgi:hypothetical protein
VRDERYNDEGTIRWSIKACDHASEVTKVTRLSAMMIEDSFDRIVEYKGHSESELEVLGRLLSSNERCENCCNKSETHNIYTKSNENINIAKSICLYPKLAYLNVLDVFVTIVHCLRTILVLFGSSRCAPACVADGILMMRGGISMMRDGK